MPGSTSVIVRSHLCFSSYVQQFVLHLALALLLTSSFDIVLVLNAGGNYRICQLIATLLIPPAIIKSRWGRERPTLGMLPLSIWLLVQVVFIPVATFWPKSVAYGLWLAVNIGLVFACVQLFSPYHMLLVKLLRWYVFSFVIVASFGILQFLLPLFGLPGLLVKQWWIPGYLARANAFSYEPSYFATYLLIGFVLISSLRRSRCVLLSSRTLLLAYAITAAGIFVSSSRMGITFLLIDVVLSQLRSWASVARDLIRRRAVLSTAKVVLPSLCLTAAAVVLCTVLVAVESRSALALTLLNGTGMLGTPAHSVNERESSLKETLGTFLDHPLVGQSLGGVSSAVADREGATVQTFEDSKNFEGMSVFAEILAASGAIGFVPFLCFLVVTIWKPLVLSRHTSPFYSALLCGLTRSLIFAWAILQFNQNVLRPYLWVHIAILATVYAAARDRTLQTASR